MGLLAVQGVSGGRMKPSPLGRVRRLCQRVQRIKYLAKLIAGVMRKGIGFDRHAFHRQFEVSQAFGQISVCDGSLTQLNEGANNVDAHVDGLWAGQYIGGLNGAVFGKGVGQRL